jgi:hypothetical protein
VCYRQLTIASDQVKFKKENVMQNNIKVQQAQERQDAWDKLTPIQQLAALDKRLGKGVGAKKQRARIMMLMKKNDVTPEIEPELKNQQTNVDEKKPKMKAKERRAKSKN